MRARELRIGNFVYRRDHLSEILEINGIGAVVAPQNFVGTIGCSEEDLKPIPLTEEWLKKFGFEENRGFTSYRIAISPLMKWACRTFIVVVVARNHHADGEAWLDLISERADHDYPELQTCSIPCTYVHQLQNLHWALTGNELQIQQP